MSTVFRDCVSNVRMLGTFLSFWCSSPLRMTFGIIGSSRRRVISQNGHRVMIMSVSLMTYYDLFQFQIHSQVRLKINASMNKYVTGN